MHLTNMHLILKITSVKNHNRRNESYLDKKIINSFDITALLSSDELHSNLSATADGSYTVYVNHTVQVNQTVQVNSSKFEVSLKMTQTI